MIRRSCLEDIKPWDNSDMLEWYILSCCNTFYCLINLIIKLLLDFIITPINPSVESVVIISTKEWQLNSGSSFPTLFLRKILIRLMDWLNTPLSFLPREPQAPRSLREPDCSTQILSSLDYQLLLLKPMLLMFWETKLLNMSLRKLSFHWLRYLEATSWFF